MNKPFYGAASIPKSERGSQGDNSGQIVNKQNVPGPGTYDSGKEKSRNDLPKWSLKKRIDQGSCFQNLSFTPAPNRYKSQEGFKKQKELIISTKGQKYHNYYEKCYPNSHLHLPGAINPKTGCSFGYREPIKENEKSPGPIYHLDLIAEKNRTIKNESRVNGFGSELKNVIKSSETPGPGSCLSQLKDSWSNKTSENWTFGTGKRSDSLPPTELGPGQYNPKNNSSPNRSFKLRGRNQLKTFEPNPLGPGAYNIPDTKTKVGTKFNKPKDNSWNVDASDHCDENISPCSYDPPRYLDSPSNNGYSLGMRIEQNYGALAEQPGPGTYEVAKNFKKGKGGYMGRKVEQKRKENQTMDNFYKYDPNISTVARQAPKFTFPQGNRSNKQIRHKSSSPEFYQTLQSKPSGYHYSMGTSKRFPELKKEMGPFKESLSNYSTIGQLPSYMKKVAAKKK